MTNRQSFLDSMNAGRRRRPTTSLEELSNTLDALEQKLAHPAPERPAFRADGPGRLRARTRRLADHTAHYEEAHEPPRAFDRRERTGTRTGRPEVDGIADEINALRGELRQQMGSGLRREFAALKNEIEHAVRNSAPASHVAELSVEFERLAAMIHKMSQKTDDRQFNLLRLEMEDVKGALSKLAREETVRSYDHRWDEMNERWNDIASHLRNDERRADAANPAIEGMSARLEQIADIVKGLPTTTTLRALEADMKSLSATVEHIAHRQDRVGPDTMAAIEDRLDGLAHAVSASLASAQPATLDPEPFARLEERIALLVRQIDTAAAAPNTGMADQLAGLSQRVEDIAHRVDLPGDMIDRLAGQIDSISRKLDEAPRAPDLEGAFSTFEDRFNALSGLLEQRQDDALAQGHALFRDLERRLEDVSDRIETAHAATQGAPSLLQVMDSRFAELTSRLDSHQAPAADDRAVRDLETRVEALSSRIDASAAQQGIDPELIRSLESQIAGLAARIAQPAPEALTPRLDKIEQSIAETRSDVIEAARRAAEDAVRSYSGAANTGDGLLVAGLVEDLKSLETLTRRSDDRNAKTFEAIHDTLLKIVDRLGAVESSATPQRAARFGTLQTPSLDAGDDALPVDAATWESPEQEQPRAKRSAAASAAAAAAQAAVDVPAAQTATGDEPGKRRSMLSGLTRAFSGTRKGGEKKDATAVQPDTAPAADEMSAVDAPAVEIDAPLDPQIANRPLEPGSGAPDLNAIMRRVRDERGIPGKGAEAEAAKSDFIAAARRAAQAAAAEAEVMKRAPAPKAKGAKGSVTSLFRNRRKPVLMGVAAVLIALAALQYGRPLLSGDGGQAVADAGAPARVESAQPIEQVEAPAATVDSAPNIMALAPEAPVDVTTDWLEDDMPTAALPDAPVPPASEIEAAEADEPADLPEASVVVPTEEAVAAIPLDAGPAALREAAASGDPKALYEIGNRYADGRGVTADAAQAAAWYGRAAEEGLAVAQYRFANMNEKGNGVPRDIAMAKSWYERAAEQGNAGAMHNLAVLHAMGADGATDNETAARWFSRAAELGVTDSQFNLGILAAKGVGIPQNLEDAYKWFALVAKTGDRDAAEKRDEVAKALRPEQLEKTRADVELWRAKTPDAEANSVEVPESWTEGDEVTASVDMRQAVRNIQHILNKNGYQAGTEDGMMGAKTKSAIAAFQTDNGMDATGEVDETLVRALLEKR